MTPERLAEIKEQIKEQITVRLVGLPRSLLIPSLELSALVDELIVEVERLAGEKDARIYYQSIVYAVCNSLDKIAGHSVRHGQGVVCGTLETPTTEVEDAMCALGTEVERLRDAVGKMSHRRCWECGHVAYYLTATTPDCLCEECGTADTRQIREPALDAAGLERERDAAGLERERDAAIEVAKRHAAEVERLREESRRNEERWQAYVRQAEKSLKDCIVVSDGYLARWSELWSSLCVVCRARHEAANALDAKGGE